MWDILSLDYSPSIKPSEILQSISRFLQDGSVVTFHDSVKTFDILQKTLPMVIKMLKDEGYMLDVIPFYTNEKLLLRS
jgi:hypothetical protein